MQKPHEMIISEDKNVFSVSWHATIKKLSPIPTPKPPR